MCGIVGAIGTGIDANLLHSLFIETQDRGKNATGFWFPNTGIVKAPQKASEFLKEHNETFQQGVKESRIFLGHTRFATHGKPENNFNNHPLESENWIMVHNGVIATMKDIDEYKYNSDTDTENLLAYIEQFGIEEGLSYCSSGASILFINKEKQDTLYLWKTYSQPLKIGYDMSNETIYIYSEEKFMWNALAPELTEEKILGGLFKHITIERKVKTSEPKPRELWSITIKDDKLECEKIEDIKNKTTNNNNWYNNNQGYHGGYGGCGYRTSFNKEKKEEELDIFVTNRQGKHRPRVIEWKAKQKEEAATTNTTTKEVVKQGESNTILPRDIVQLKRNPGYADHVQTSVEGMLLSLSTSTKLMVRKYLTGDRLAVEDINGILYVMPSTLLKLADPPTCLGLTYDSNSSKCEECFFHLDCAEVHYAQPLYGSAKLPECIGGFEEQDDECAICEHLVPCIANLKEEKDFIDAEFAEANEEITNTHRGIT
jgi:predicted glutamine amidotransferase